MTRRPHALAILTVLLLAPLAATPAQFATTEYAQRRAALLAQIADGVVLALGAHEPAQDYLSFYQTPSFNYLTGLVEPDAALVIVKSGGSVTSTLFVEPRIPAREVWVGTRLGVDGAQRRTALPTREIGDLAQVLDSLSSSGLPWYVVGDFSTEDPGSGLTPDQQFVSAFRSRHPAIVVKNATPHVLQLRATKSPAELALIRQAAEITARAERDAMQALAPGMNEFEIQALVEYTFRRNGAERPSFASIIGSGPNATALHYNLDDRFIEGGDIVVMDIGASYKGYAADVTRSIPANGTYSPEQRAIYQIVRDAQGSAERQAKLGAPAHFMSDSATAVLAAGLTRLGLIEAPGASYDCDAGGQTAQCPQYDLYYMHGLGHGIGLEVHDPDQAEIAPGDAFTIEPGIYVRSDVLDVLPQTPRNRALIAKLRPAVNRYRNIGIRIEDDYIATPNAVEWISRAPREMAEIEAIMKTPRSTRASRDSALIERYRRP
ncbi:MAG TPA: aminopeptidase P N-terminal domain-containing protein [Gemmatimonadaceae bacterium]|jgi:Xaa-Pro aminopeptidase